MNSDDRQYDVVVWGASGFTGRLVVEYLLESYAPGGNLRWAVAGRNKTKIEQLFNTLDDEIPKPAIIIADSHDPESLDRVATSTRVLLTTVGPYAKYGSELVAACVKNGTHYCDLCGEVQWMRQMIDKHQAAAQESGARIVMSCGFDSIPSDMGLWFLQRHAMEKHGQACTEATLLVRAMKGGAIDFLEKPFSSEQILGRIEQAVEWDSSARRGRAEAREAECRLALLTPRERQVLDLILAGRLNKQIAGLLGIAQRTVEVHRQQIMKKMQAETGADLARMVLSVRGAAAARTPATQNPQYPRALV